MSPTRRNESRRTPHLPPKGPADLWGEIVDLAWARVQDGVNSCHTCKNEPCFEVGNLPPGRPWNPQWRGRLVLISEAPPRGGGFWHLGRQGDRLRQTLLRLLRDKGLPVPADADGQDALQAFLDWDFFLMQALKWPLAEGKGFHQLGASEQRRLVEHAADHTYEELRVLAPRGILAMGGAAWQVCRKVSGSPERLPEGGVEAIRGTDYALVLRPGRTAPANTEPIPLNVTFLPVDQNLRVPEREQAIRGDLEAFLERHEWRFR